CARVSFWIIRREIPIAPVRISCTVRPASSSPTLCSVHRPSAKSPPLSSRFGSRLAGIWRGAASGANAGLHEACDVLGAAPAKGVSGAAVAVAVDDAADALQADGGATRTDPETRTAEHRAMADAVAG